MYLAPPPPWETPFYKRVLDGRKAGRGNSHSVSQTVDDWGRHHHHHPHHSQHQFQNQNQNQNQSQNQNQARGPQEDTWTTSTGRTTKLLQEEVVLPVDTPVSVTVTVGGPSGAELVLTFLVS
ncbi:E4 [Tursiops truncatus papillomavirus 6]|uniref:E4 n=1 Tax=Tursiops truncatus papillomavirus 6 TaxID=1144382 RepID=H6UYP9_PSPV|nr:E4 [Tursiops truncatus papillomavirus 6]